MAKQRSGLGRGLNSLLGGSFNTNSNENTEENFEKKGPSVDTQDTKTAQPDNAQNQDNNLELKQFNYDENDHVVIGQVVERDVVSQIEEIKDDSSEKEKPVNSTIDTEKDNVKIIDINQIAPNPNQPRTIFDKEELEELTNSIKSHGLLQPILVRTTIDNKYQIIAGERRWQASKKAGLTEVSVQIKNVSDEKVLEFALVENLQRSNLNPIEEAYGYKRLMELNKISQTDVAKIVSKGRSTIANSLRLLDLPEKAQELLFNGKITPGHARAILSVTSTKGRDTLTEKLKNEALSVREVEALARLMEGREKRGDQSKREPTPKYFKKAAKELRGYLHTNVRVKTVQGKNKIEIEFTSEEQLLELLKLISKDDN